MSLHRDIDSLVPAMQSRVQKFKGLLDAAGIEVRIEETLREQIVQDAYYTQGRLPLDQINGMRKLAGLWLIGEAEAKRIITWTTKSNHSTGRAIDIWPIVNDAKIPTSSPLWQKVGEMGEQAGMVWGGRWKQKDLVHFELPEGVKDDE